MQYNFLTIQKSYNHVSNNHFDGHWQLQQRRAAMMMVGIIAIYLRICPLRIELDAHTFQYQFHDVIYWRRIRCIVQQLFCSLTAVFLLPICAKSTERLNYVEIVY